MEALTQTSYTAFISCPIIPDSKSYYPDYTKFYISYKMQFVYGTQLLLGSENLLTRHSLYFYYTGFGFFITILWEFVEDASQ